MPPKKSKPKKKVQAPSPVAPVAHSDSESDGDPTPEAAAPIDPEVSRGSEEADYEGRQDIEEKIAQFFEDRPYFYDISSEIYKNKRRRDCELAEFAASLGPKWDGKCTIITIHF